MSKQTAIKFHVRVGPDHTIRLPDDVPVGPAEVIVILEERPDDQANGGEKSVLGMFADEAEIVDEAMAYVRERRKNWRTRPST